ncbi:hypothetical protein ACTXT7_008626 [Hymenolepis weldensis]
MPCIMWASALIVRSSNKLMSPKLVTPDLVTLTSTSAQINKKYFSKNSIGKCAPDVVNMNSPKKQGTNPGLLKREC